jgi:hypothetical protein
MRNPLLDDQVPLLGVVEARAADENPVQAFLGRFAVEQGVPLEEEVAEADIFFPAWDGRPMQFAEQRRLHDLFVGHLAPGDILVLGNQQARPPIHPLQVNTHAASIHQSASQSARSLAARYPAVDEEMVWQQLQQWGEKLSTEGAGLYAAAHPKAGQANEAMRHQAVKSFLAQSGCLAHLDLTSNVTVKQLYVFLWVAIHDHQARIEGCEVSEGLQALKCAMYESQRGNNLGNEALPTDNLLADRPICAAGAFNKAFEKMVGVLKDVELKVVTWETFGNFFKYQVVQCLKKRFENPVHQVIKQEIIGADYVMTLDAWALIRAEVSARVLGYHEGEVINGRTPNELLSQQIDNIEYLNVREAL